MTSPERRQRRREIYSPQKYVVPVLHAHLFAQCPGAVGVCCSLDCREKAAVSEVPGFVHAGQRLQGCVCKKVFQSAPKWGSVLTTPCETRRSCYPGLRLKGNCTVGRKSNSPITCLSARSVSHGGSSQWPSHVSWVSAQTRVVSVSVVSFESVWHHLKRFTVEDVISWSRPSLCLSASVCLLASLPPPPLSLPLSVCVCLSACLSPSSSSLSPSVCLSLVFCFCCSWFFPPPPPPHPHPPPKKGGEKEGGKKGQVVRLGFC